MKPIKSLVSIATGELFDEREKAAVAALKLAMTRIESMQRNLDDANKALTKLKDSIEDGSFVPPHGAQAQLSQCAQAVNQSSGFFR